MKPDSATHPDYVIAFEQIATRIADSLSNAPKSALPVTMFVFGGGAMHFYTGERVSNHIDATFSHRIALPDDLEISYRAKDGAAKLLYFDRQFNDTYALVHEDAFNDSVSLELNGVDSQILDIRLLSALDLAVSKIRRLAQHDRTDIEALAKRGLIESSALRKRSTQALKYYVGNLDRVKTSINLACNTVAAVEKQKS